MIKATETVISTTIDCLAKCNDFDCLVDEILDEIDHQTYNSFLVAYGDNDLALGHIVTTSNSEFGAVILTN